MLQQGMQRLSIYTLSSYLRPPEGRFSHFEGAFTFCNGPNAGGGEAEESCNPEGHSERWCREYI